jgi:hypothetical protein
MNRNELIEKIRRGEIVTPEDVAAVQAADQLKHLQSEAVELNNIADLEEKRRQMRDKQILTMVEADGQAEAATRDLERLTNEFDRFCLAFGRKYLQTRFRIILAQQKFGSQIKSAIPRIDKLKTTHAPELESDLKELLGIVKDKGAKLESVCSEGWQPHITYQPPYFRNSYELPPTKFGALLSQVEKIISMLPADPPTPENESATPESSDDDGFELWAFAQAAAHRAEAGIIEPAQDKAA